jgi:hypothetical protein
MAEVLFCLSLGFVGYVIYVLVDEQKVPNPGMPEEGVVVVKPSRPRTPRKTATAAKAKSAAVKKSAPEPVNSTADALLAYLEKNGLTTIAKLTRELPESRKMIEDCIDRLSREGTISQTTIARAKAVALKS